LDRFQRGPISTGDFYIPESEIGFTDCNIEIAIENRMFNVIYFNDILFYKKDSIYWGTKTPFLYAKIVIGMKIQ
jgi:hypothetical protein